MNIIRTTFDWAGDLYSRLFADWLHIHFLIRTILLLLLLWLVVFLAAQLLRYVLLPLAMMFYYHVIFRAWNFLFVETPQEWLYLQYRAKDKPDYARLYSRLCDKVKKNRMILDHTKFMGMVIRARRPALGLMVIALVTVTFWASAFGLHQEYYAPVLLVVDNRPQDPPPDEENEEPEYDYFGYDYGYVYEPEEAETEGTYAPGTINPAEWAIGSSIILTLTEQGSQGARLRDAPEISGSTVIEILWDNAELLYLHSFTPDEYVNNLYWLRVRTPSGAEGYISSQLVEFFE